MYINMIWKETTKNKKEIQWGSSLVDLKLHFKQLTTIAIQIWAGKKRK